VLGHLLPSLATRNAGQGTIVADQVYQFSFFAGINSVTDPTGVGTVTLAFAPITGPGGTPGVPLPAGVWMGIAGAACVGG
jgi:hypothetical protein